MSLVSPTAVVKDSVNETDRCSSIAFHLDGFRSSENVAASVSDPLKATSNRLFL